MNGLSGANGSNVSIPLIGKHDQVGPGSLYPCGHRDSSSMGSLSHVYINVVVSQHSAPGRRHPHGLFPNPEFVNHFTHQSVYDAVAAAGAIVSNIVF
jgi:hypothetical protein